MKQKMKSAAMMTRAIAPPTIPLIAPGDNLLEEEPGVERRDVAEVATRTNVTPEDRADVMVV